MRTLWGLAIVFACILCACSPSAEPQETSKITIEADYLRLLDDLTVLMSASHQDPAQNLENVRKYVTESRTAASGMLNKLNQEVLNMSSDEREKWRCSAKPRVEVALDRFANAQMQLHQRLNEAQKWELGEILGLLR